MTPTLPHRHLARSTPSAPFEVAITLAVPTPAARDPTSLGVKGDHVRVRPRRAQVPFRRHDVEAAVVTQVGLRCHRLTDRHDTTDGLTTISKPPLAHDRSPATHRKYDPSVANDTAKASNDRRMDAEPPGMMRSVIRRWNDEIRLDPYRYSYRSACIG